MKTLRINNETHASLKEIAKYTGRSMSSLVSEAIEMLRRKYILEMTNKAYRKD